MVYIFSYHTLLDKVQFSYGFFPQSFIKTIQSKVLSFLIPQGQASRE